MAPCGCHSLDSLLGCSNGTAVARGKHRDNPFPGALETAARQTGAGPHSTDSGGKQDGGKCEASLGTAAKLSLTNRKGNGRGGGWRGGCELRTLAALPESLVLIPSWRLTAASKSALGGSMPTSGFHEQCTPAIQTYTGKTPTYTKESNSHPGWLWYGPL